MIQSKKIFNHFICFWKWFLSLFVFMFSAYFVFHCLNMFCVEKQVSKFFATHLATYATHENFCDSTVAQCKLRVHQEAFATHLVTYKNFCDSLSREIPRNNFLNGFLWETYFKPLPSSLKPLFHYFYIKTQSIWMIFHSIKISKVILNSFHCFGSLDYVLESFVLLVEIFIIRVEKTFFFAKFLYVIGFFWWFALDVGPLWQKEHVLRVDFMMFMHCFTLLFIVCTLGVW